MNENMIKKIAIDNIERIETGAVQFNDDFPGMFIRGDDAYALSLEISSLLGVIENGMQIDPISQLDLNWFVQYIQENVILPNKKESKMKKPMPLAKFIGGELVQVINENTKFYISDIRFDAISNEWRYAGNEYILEHNLKSIPKFNYDEILIYKKDNKIFNANSCYYNDFAHSWIYSAKNDDNEYLEDELELYHEWGK